MKFLSGQTPSAFACESAGHIYADDSCCGRRGFLAGLAATAGALLPIPASAQSEKAFRIDTHHHLSSPAFIAAITARKTGQVPLMNWTVEKSLADMDKGGVATSIVSISEPGVYFGDGVAARALARECNEFGATLMAAHPGRFGLFAIVPLPDIDGTLREIAYALDTLKADGICMMSDVQGKFLGDPAFTAVMEELNRRKAVVFTHPFRNACCLNMIPGVPDPTLELGFDTTRTIASIVFSGTAHRFPDIKWIFSHAGGAAPFLMQRFTSLFAARKELQERLPHGPAYYMERFYYDTASASTAAPLAALNKAVKPTQILFGTDFPFGSSAAVAAGLRATGLFTASDVSAIERGNAVHIMPRFRT
jgi:predicted TIM-barrel fold metal-dependent hydrolase